MAKTLYICYLGVCEPLVQTQVIPYLLEIKRGGIDVALLTFEPDLLKQWSSEQIEQERVRLADKGIQWHVMPYHKRPSGPATIYDIVRGNIRVRQLMKHEKYDVLHCRVHVPGLIGVLARKLSRQKPKIIFDIRGFFPEEYIDAGLWRRDGWLFKAVKRIENWIMREADGFVVLTEAARTIVFPEIGEAVNVGGTDILGRPVEVIPCCVDFEGRSFNNVEKTRDSVRGQMNITDRFVIVHLGALGGLYLTDEIVDFLVSSKSQRPNAFAMFLTQSDPNLIVPRLLERGFTAEDFFVKRVTPGDVSAYMSAADVAISFVMATFATQSRSPTKIPEYLACGLPVISNRGVGDVDELVTRNRVGVLIDGFSEASYVKALAEVDRLGDVRQRCEATAKSEFDLEEVAGKRYRRLYERVLTKNGR